MFDSLAHHRAMAAKWVFIETVKLQSVIYYMSEYPLLHVYPDHSHGPGNLEQMIPQQDYLDKPGGVQISLFLHITIKMTDH